MQIWFLAQPAMFQALLATLFTWSATALGAATIFMVRDINRKVTDVMLGFAAGVTIAASFWSLLAAAGLLSATVGAAIALAIGIGLQNFPEGAAVSLPIRREGFSRGKSFFYG